MENLLNLYLKDTFTEQDSKLIDNAIDTAELFTDDIKDDCLDYIYRRMELEGIDYVDETDIWEYTDEHLSNGLTHAENYNNFKKYLKQNFLIP